MKLIDDWHKAWKWFSVQLIAAAGTAQLALLAFPDALKHYIPESWMHAIVLALLAAAVLGRLVDQPKA
jgi:hypothetical protein